MTGADRPTVLQALTEGPGRVVMRHVPAPAIEPDQLELEVRRIGICGSDLHVYLGHHPTTHYPVVQGHEVAGIVSRLGDRVTKFSIGDLVALKPQLSCGVCAMCTSEREHICESLRVMGFQAPGAGQERIAIEQSQAVRLPPTLPLDHAALVEPLAVTAHALGRLGSAPANVLVIGAGPIGNLLGQLAAVRGARVLVADIVPMKLDVAAAAGLAVIDASRDEFEERVRDEFPGGPDLVAECVGSEAAIASAVRLAASGGAILVLGVHGRPATVAIGLVQDRELSVVGSLMYRREDYETAVEMLSSGRIDVSRLITHRYHLEQLPAAYEDIIAQRDSVLKAMVTVGD